MIIHSTVLAPDGRRMSKSLGTGIDPLELIDEYGADATRYGLLKMSSTQDVRFTAQPIEEGRQAREQALERAAGCCCMPAARAGAGEPVVGRGAVDPRAHRRDARGDRGRLSTRFDFAHAVDALYHLTFDDFCDWYAEAIKPRLYAETRTRRRPRSPRSSGCSSCSIR